MPGWLLKSLLVAFVAIVAGTFIISGVIGTPGGEGGIVGYVAGEPIRRDSFEWMRNLQKDDEQLEQLPSELRNQIMDQQARAALVRRFVLAREARELGLGVSDRELQRDLWANPDFQQDGRYSPEVVEAVAEQTRLGRRGFRDEYRRDLLIRKYERLVESPVRVSRAAARWELQRQKTTVSLRYATASAAELRAGVTVHDAEVKKLLADDPARVRGRYDQRIDQYRVPEQIHARHILFSGEQAQEQASQALAELRAGADFATLARERSTDEATREQGGDLGWLRRGLMLEEFDAPAFALEPGSVSEPVRTERGVHLIRVEERQAASETPYEQVAEALARELLVEERADARAREAAERVLAAARSGQELSAAAAEAGLAVAVTPPFHLYDAEIPGLPGLPELRGVAFALRPEQPLAGQVFGADGRYYAVELAERSEPEAQEIEAELGNTRERMAQLERQQTSALWYRKRYEELEADGELVVYPPRS
jgi:peptidyl-prolyl cis-trans isomerase D